MSPIEIPAEKLRWLDEIALAAKSHRTLSEGACAMEAAAYLAGEAHTDRPECVCPVISEFVLRWNDSLESEKERSAVLKPLIPEILGTRSTPEVELKRGFMLADWAVRVAAPSVLEASGFMEFAKRLRDLPEIVDANSAKSGHTASGSASRAAQLAPAFAEARVADAAARCAGHVLDAAVGRFPSEKVKRGRIVIAATVAQSALCDFQALSGSAQDLIRRMAAIGKKDQ